MLVAEVYVIVQVSMPPGMTPESTVNEIRKSIGFGRPSVQLLAVIESKKEDSGYGL